MTGKAIKHRMKIVRQGEDDKMCGQCCLATLLREDVGRVCELMGIQKGKQGPHRVGTNRSDLVEFLESRGWDCHETTRTNERYAVKSDMLVPGDFGQPPSEYLYAVVKSTYRAPWVRKTPMTHWMLWWAMDPMGLYCPNRGRMQVKSWYDATAPNKPEGEERVTSYFIVSPR